MADHRYCDYHNTKVISHINPYQGMYGMVECCAVVHYEKCDILK